MCKENAASKEWVWLLACEFYEPLEEGIVYFLAAELGDKLVIVDFAGSAGRDVPRSDDLCLLEGKDRELATLCNVMESGSSVEGDVRMLPVLLVYCLCNLPSSI